MAWIIDAAASEMRRPAEIRYLTADADGFRWGAEVEALRFSRRADAEMIIMVLRLGAIERAEAVLRLDAIEHAVPVSKD